MRADLYGDEELKDAAQVAMIFSINSTKIIKQLNIF